MSAFKLLSLTPKLRVVEYELNKNKYWMLECVKCGYSLNNVPEPEIGKKQCFKCKSIYEKNIDWDEII